MKKHHKNSIAIDVYFQSLESFKKKIENAISKREKLLQPSSEVYFESVAEFRKFMTFHKFELLSAIAYRKPNSIYELAKLLDRDFASVLRDCVALAGVGFLVLEEKKDARGSKAPKLPFAYSVIRIHFPNNSHQMEFNLAA